MRRLVHAALLLAGPPLWFPVESEAQARGPSAAEILEEGQDVGSSEPDTAWLNELAREYDIDPQVLASGNLTLRAGGLFVRQGNQYIGLEKLRRPEVVDDAERAGQLEQQAAWLTRLPGRFRIGGRVEARTLAGAVGAGPGSPFTATRTMRGDISGIADCATVGDGTGVRCLFNAYWPTIEPVVAQIGGPAPPSETLRTFRPAVMVMGMNPDTAELRALLVTDDSLAFTLAGRLAGNTLRARLVTGCIELERIPPDPRCFRTMEINVEPDREAVSIMLTAGSLVIRFELRRDAEAVAEKPVPRKKVR